MKPFTRVKVIKGNEYLYEITPYYDPVEKKIRQKSKYLGKLVNDQPIKVRSQKKPLISIPEKVLSYGEYLPLLKIVEELKLDLLLSKSFSEKQAWSILTLAMNHIIKPLAYDHIEEWYEGTVLSKDHPELPLSSQSISNLLDSIGNSAVHIDFAKSLIKEVCTSNTLIYDITSISTYSQMISLLEYGYNRDNLDLPQINFSMIVDKEKGIPVMYDLYPRSISDVTTLKNTIKKLQEEGVHDYTLIMDKGFISTANIESLVSNDLSFIVPPSQTIKSVKEKTSEIHKTIYDPQNLNVYEGEPIFTMQVDINVGELNVKGYAYYDQKREHQERNSFFKGLHATLEMLEKVDLRRWMDPKMVFISLAKRYASYLTWKVKDNKFEIKVKKNAVSQRVNKMGKFILLYRGNLEWDECLSLYRSKDIVEKGFYFLKNYIEVPPANVKKNSTLKGHLFICFVSLIIRMKLMKEMKEAKLNKKFSVESLIVQLEKNKILLLSEGEQIVMERTKKQKEILDALGICA